MTLDMTKLIQRCSAPRPRKHPLGISNPFTFGVGGGHFKPEALDLLAPIFKFEYMMKGEFEFGAVPQGLSKIWETANAKNLAFSSIDVAPKDVKHVKIDKYSGYVKRDWKVCPVFIIGPATDMEEVQRRVRLIATDEDHCLAEFFKKGLHKDIYLACETQLGRYIKTVPTYDDPTTGWLELDNGFFFSVDPGMTERFAALFGLSIEIKSAR